MTMLFKQHYYTAEPTFLQGHPELVGPAFYSVYTEWKYVPPSPSVPSEAFICNVMKDANVILFWT